MSHSKYPINITHCQAVIASYFWLPFFRFFFFFFFGFLMLLQDGQTRVRRSASIQTQAGCYFQKKCRPVAGANTITVWLCVYVCTIRAIAWGDEDSPRLTSVQTTRDGHSITSPVSLNCNFSLRFVTQT